ncbi:hypothetical protein EBS57_10770, partial [bacterium]|nr:hypothetical protein [bacterium]
MRIGVDISNYANGYMSNYRFITGSNAYDAALSSITVPTSPVSAVTGTQLLTCQSNRFRDASTNNFTITPNNSPSVQAFSPFAPTATYSATTHGGSGYFDGSGDYLSVADNAAFTASGDFTLEAWYYPLSNPADAGIVSMNDGGGGGTGPRITVSGGTFAFNVYNNLIIAGTSIIGQWHHLALVRSGTGSNNCAAYVNGVRVGTTTNTTTQDPNGIVLGRYYTNTNNFYINGYISSTRYVVGTAVYDPTQTTLTVPTAPLTNITTTSLLLNFTNDAIEDATGRNVLETVGDARTTSAVTKWAGQTSMYFDGTGDYLKTVSNSVFNCGTGNWT